MKGLKWALLVLILGLTMGARPARAELIHIQSKISEVDLENHYIKVYHLDPQTDETEEVELNIDDSTIFNKGLSMEKLKEGDTISAEADFNVYTHDWKAVSIGLYIKQEE